MANTSKMNMPLLAADQSQKHVTHNEALNIIDAFTHPSVINRTRTSPPGSPTEGDQYIIAASATGDWAGHDHEVTTYQNGAWVFFEPYIGMHAWIQDEGVESIYTAVNTWHGAAVFSGVTWTYPTIASGVLTIASSAVVPAPESGSSDDVDSIAGGQDGRTLIVKGTSGKTITFNDGGNMKLGAATRVFDNSGDVMMLVRFGTDWLEISYSNNG